MLVRFEFHGGFKDGETVVGDANIENSANPARRYLILSDRGTVGARFRETLTIEAIEAAWAKVDRAMQDLIERRARNSGKETVEELDGRLREAMKEHQDRRYLLATNHISHLYEVASREDGKDETVIAVNFVAEEREPYSWAK